MGEGWMKRGREAERQRDHAHLIDHLSEAEIASTISLLSHQHIHDVIFSCPHLHLLVAAIGVPYI